jgi:carboxyl-terminal processing protease
VGTQEDGCGLGQEILHLLDRHFVDQKLLHEWKSAGLARELVQACKSNSDAKVDELLRQIGLSHTLRLTPRQIDYYHVLDTYASAGVGVKLKALFPEGIVRYPSIDIRARKKEHRIFVSAVAEGGPAQRAGLLQGDELVSVNDLPFEPVESLRAWVGKPITVGYRREAGGPVLSALITPTLSRVRELLVRATRGSARAILWRSKSVGYIRPWSIAGDRYWRVFKETVSRRFGNCCALVLDLRSGLGGAAPEYAEFFIGRSPDLSITGSHQERGTINEHWRKPVVLIIDETTRSGNEVMAFALKRAGIPTVGARTAGEVTMGMPLLLSDDSLMIVARAAVLVDGVKLEEAGVEPDLVVPHDLSYSAGADPRLETALDQAVRLSARSQTS